MNWSLTNPEAVVTARYVNRDVSPQDFFSSDWEACEPVKINRLWSGGAAPPSRHAEVRLLWSNDSLALRFVCRQHEPLLINSAPQLQRKTMKLWERDVCEIFIAPKPEDPNRYIEFEAAPSGEWIDLGVTILPDQTEKDWGLETGMSTATDIQENQFTLIIRVPWTTVLPKPDLHTEWRINLFRCIGTGDARYLAWQPTYTPEPNFHVPQAFGRLRFQPD